MTRPDDVQWEFGPFRLDGTQRLLFRNGELLPVTRKAADILVVLLENHGQLVEKEALMTRVWPDSFVEDSNLAVHISLLRKILGEGDGLHRIETIPRRGYRFVGEVKVPAGSEPPRMPQSPATSAEQDGLPLPASSHPPRSSRTPWSRWVLLALGAAGCLAAILLVSLRLARPGTPSSPTPKAAPAPPRQDSIVLADIDNNTGDPVFNTTLRQALAIELEQSPVLRLLPETRIQQSLKMMGRRAGAPLTPDVSREICQRNQGEAVVDGWIAKLGAQYVMGVRALNCRTGDHLADLEATAAGKEQVLKALGDATGQLRAKLGESLTTVQRFDTPIEEATTPSLEALQAYSIGKATMIQKAESASCVPFFQRAIRLDPDFAIAYAALGNAYSNLGEMGLAADNLRRAYELRQRVSEHERLYIESHYHELVTGDLAKAAGIYETWAATYPDDVVPRTDLALIDSDLGKFPAALDQAKAALEIAPDDSQNYENLANAYISLDRLSDARATIGQALSRKLDSSDLHLYLYDLAFLQHDNAAMEQQLTWAAGEPGIEDVFLGHSADTLAFAGQLSKARELTQRATDAAKRAGQKETAAGYEVAGAEREALFGNPSEAQRLAQQALALAHDRDTRFAAAVALALAGASDQADRLADQLDRDFPNDTIVQAVYLPSIRGAVALDRKDPARAIHLLESAAPYELGASCGMLPVYLRGLAYLASKNGPQAQIEFAKLIAHPGALLNSPLGPLARLQLAHAYQLEGNPAQAKAALGDFRSMWSNADPDLPILLAAKSESVALGH